MDSVRVLHVDDIPDFTGLVADHLSHADDRLDVWTTHSAEDALDRLEADASLTVAESSSVVGDAESTSEAL